MLYMLGPAAFQVAPLNSTDISREGAYQFAEHQVLGAAPLYENMGEGSRTRTIKGATFPRTQGFEGGALMLEALETARRAGVPMHLIRGDGRPLGWFLITGIKEEGGSLDGHGVPRELRFDISLAQCDAPSVADFISIIGGFF